MSTGDYGAYPPDPRQQPAYGYGGPPAARPATLGIRFLARLLDGILVAILASILTSLLGFGSDTVLGVPSYSLYAGLFSGVLTFVYFVGFEVWKGWTPAKKLLGLEVRGVGGAPKPDLRQPCAICSRCCP
jgi:uncharacterized RDD family membrane protein YckC